jgi:hypothetical protein
MYLCNKDMAKKTLLPEERKIKIGISLDRELYEYMELITKNKSKFIETLIRIEYTKYTQL